MKPIFIRKDIAFMLGVTYNTVYKWEKELNIFKQPYTSANIELLRSRKKQPKRHNKIKIHIIDFFLNNIQNTAKQIALLMGLKESYVHQVLNEWVDNDKCILVDSKINN